MRGSNSITSGSSASHFGLPGLNTSSLVGALLTDVTEGLLDHNSHNYHEDEAGDRGHQLSGGGGGAFSPTRAGSSGSPPHEEDSHQALKMLLATILEG